MIQVSFLKGWRMYQPGEIAGFDALIAGQLVEAGFAVLVDGAEAPKATRKARSRDDVEGGER